MLTFPVYPHHEVDICGFERNALITIERIAFKLGADTRVHERMYNVNPNLFLVKYPIKKNTGHYINTSGVLSFLSKLQMLKCSDIKMSPLA